MNWIPKKVRKVLEHIFVPEGPPLMDPKLISGVHVEVTFDVMGGAKDLSEVLNMLTELRAYIEARPNVVNTDMEQMVELNGVFWEGGEPKTTKGVLHKLQEGVDNG